MMIGVFIVPTGLGAQIGGHAGDANPAAKLIASCCDKLIVHPNVVNASDINEMTENMLYVDGHMLDRFLTGSIGLKEVTKPNRIILAANPPITPMTINAVNAARVTIGADIEIVELHKELKMIASTHEGGKQQGGLTFGVDHLVDQFTSAYAKGEFDVLALHTPILVQRDIALDYLRNGGINPWGGVEAQVSRQISKFLKCPVAHAPLDTTPNNDPELLNFNEIVHSRIAPEQISNAYLHCVLKGLHRAPLPVVHTATSIHPSDVDFMISPWCEDGEPHKACMKRGIPIIYVKSNSVEACRKSNQNGLVALSYLEAAGMISCMNAGVTPVSVL